MYILTNPKVVNEIVEKKVKIKRTHTHTLFERFLILIVLKCKI